MISLQKPMTETWLHTYEILFWIERNVCTANEQFDSHVHKKISTATRIWNEDDVYA